jgi:hypothetical protein
VIIINEGRIVADQHPDALREAYGDLEKAFHELTMGATAEPVAAAPVATPDTAASAAPEKSEAPEEKEGADE